MLRKLAAIMGVSGAILLGAQSVDAGTYWTRYEKASGSAKVRVVVIKTACINGEDSAGMLRLRSYDGTKAVYGCKRP